jgi:3-methyladenine DNA glycosylase AlkD
MGRDAAMSMVQGRLAAVADPERARSVAAYLKTDMPLYGVARPDLKPILKDLVAAVPPGTPEDYRGTIRALWDRPHREEKYLAIGFARSFDDFVDTGSLDLYETLIIEGAWWDLVDEIAIRLVGRALEKDRSTVTTRIRPWIASDDLWLRRTSIICQVTRGTSSDLDLLADACAANLADGNFFIRKAIGWALRDLSKSDPDWVRGFIDTYRDELSGLSLREASKYL